MFKRPRDGAADGGAVSTGAGEQRAKELGK
jgi:hypothetical protein